nr:signal anchor, putative [Ipomoea batatas]
MSADFQLPEVDRVDLHRIWGRESLPELGEQRPSESVRERVPAVGFRQEGIEIHDPKVTQDNVSFPVKVGCSYAKANTWFLLVVCIFTDMSISPSLPPRPCPNRYASRAGRNLPDKEFRYLGTVIVTVAVHWDFGRWLPCH